MAIAVVQSWELIQPCNDTYGHRNANVTTVSDSTKTDVRPSALTPDLYVAARLLCLGAKWSENHVGRSSRADGESGAHILPRKPRDK